MASRAPLPSRRPSRSAAVRLVLICSAIADLGGTALAADDDDIARRWEDARARRAHPECNSDGAEAGSLSVRPSTMTGGGLGVFAERDFKAGDVLAFYTGVPLVLPFRCEKGCYESLYAHLGPSDFFDYVLYVEPLNATHHHTVVADTDLCPGLLSGMVNSHTYAAGNNVVYGPSWARGEGGGRYISMGHESIQAMWLSHPLSEQAERELEASGFDADDEGEEVHEVYAGLMQRVWPFNATHTPFVAMRDIAAGEEVLSDYGFQYWHYRRPEFSVSSLRLLDSLAAEVHTLGLAATVAGHPLLTEVLGPLLSIRERGGDACAEYDGLQGRAGEPGDVRGNSAAPALSTRPFARYPRWAREIEESLPLRYIAALAGALRHDWGCEEVFCQELRSFWKHELGHANLSAPSPHTRSMRASELSRAIWDAMAYYLDFDLRNARRRLVLQEENRARLALAADFLALYVYLYLPGWCASPHSAMRAFLDGASGLRERLQPPL